MLTGCLRISKESTFTRLNNSLVNSVRSGDYSSYFAFTENEVKGLAEYYGLLDKFDSIKEWYDRYKFGVTDIYNPWSVLNYINCTRSLPDAFPEPYWSNTSSNSIIYKLIRESDQDVKEKIEDLLNGGSVTVPIYEDTVYFEIDVRSDHIWNFLLFTAFLKQDTTRIEDTICDWLDETISHHDEKEQYYHGFMIGLLSGFKGYSLKSNRESGNGRYDLVLMERRRHNKAIIIEIKNAEKFSRLDYWCDYALNQIEENHYESEILNEGYSEILKYGIAFYKKTCKVKNIQNNQSYDSV